MNLEDYFSRIHYNGAAAASLNTLRELHFLHTQHIPFENLSPLAGAPVSIELPDIVQKLVHDKRGGYCFEHNHLFKAVLEEIGFKVTGWSGRVLWNGQLAHLAPRTHMLLRVEVEGREYIADVGFGSMTLTSPILFQPDIAQSTPHETFRIMQTDGHYVLEVQIRNVWVPVYMFYAEEQLLIDYKLANWYVSTHPDSIFRKDLMVARTGAGVRYVLVNNVLSVRHTGKDAEKRELKDEAEVNAVLREIFGIERK
ncbi:arylamine N-acetyltransferase family protein [Chitinophaga cymbidii]|uniref:N-hydroxyarylamine O-acetyltransferase n=1 Tax=Chitinophaga cymbidii TaxID=1096750 RepID=A0A512RQB5_9BACT|nr:arylamine N-acetyltransferase [Chitinophaga cymbidii]GEP97886.1 N-hydroxyarylamine O-acetyltransferase [Chitinophaga cymbidii]